MANDEPAVSSDQPARPKTRRNCLIIAAATFGLLACAVVALSVLSVTLLGGEQTTNTAAPRPTRPPRPTPTATPVPDPANALRTAVGDALGDSNRDANPKVRLFQVRSDERSISVTWAADDNLTLGMVGAVIQTDAAAVLNAIIDGRVPYDWVFLSATYPAADGDETDVFIASYTAAALRDAGPVSPIDVLDLADHYTLHPDFQ